MRFVEAVAGKFFEQIENLVRLGFRNVVLFLATLDENGALLRHLLGLFLAHGAPQQIGAAEGVAGQHLRSLHHLLLVNQNAVGLAGDRLEQWMFVFDFYFAVAPFDEFGDEIHRAGTIERDERRDMFDRIDLKLPAQVAHPAGFQLENAERVRLVQQVVRSGVLERQMVDGNVDALRPLHHFTGVANDGERLEAEEIHLQQAKVSDRPHRVLRHDGALLIGLEREQIHERLVGDDDPRRVHRRVAHEVFESKRRVDQFARDFLRFIGLLEFGRNLERLRQCHLEFVRNHPGQAVAFAVAQAHHATDVAHD